MSFLLWNFFFLFYARKKGIFSSIGLSRGKVLWGFSCTSSSSYAWHSRWPAYNIKILPTKANGPLSHQLRLTRKPVPRTLNPRFSRFYRLLLSGPDRPYLEFNFSSGKDYDLHSLVKFTKCPSRSIPSLLHFARYFKISYI